MAQRCLLTSRQLSYKVARAMATYSETVLLQYADDLLEQANAIIAILTLKYGAVAAVATFCGLAAVQFAMKTDLPIPVVTLLIALVGALLGAIEGRRRSFELRLEAQKILALIEIEHHTRHVA